MPDLETSLRQALHDRAAQITEDTLRNPRRPAAASQPARGARRRTRWLAAASAVVVIAVAALVVAVNLHTTGKGAATSASTTTTAFADGLTLRHPAQWRHVRGPEIAGMEWDVAGYLTNEPTVTQCHFARDGSGGCHSPVTTLGHGGVLVAVLDQFGNPPDPVRITPTARIDGYPAQVTRSRHPQTGSDEGDCPPGARESIETIVQTSGGDAHYQIIACLAGPHMSRSERRVQAMLDTATLKPPCLTCPGPTQPSLALRVTIGGRTFTPKDRVHPRIGEPVGISLTVTSTHGATIKNLRLFVDAYPYSAKHDKLTGKFHIVARHDSTIHAGQTITATWTATPLWGTRRLELSVWFDTNNANTGDELVELRVTP
jgi:hypothetical protein